MKKLKFRAIGLVCATLFAGSAMAQQVTLRLHQFLPPQATIPAKAIIPWAQKVEKRVWRQDQGADVPRHANGRLARATVRPGQGRRGRHHLDRAGLHPGPLRQDGSDLAPVPCSS